MPVHATVLISSPQLKPYAKRLRLITKTVERAAGQFLPLKDVDVVFYDNPEGVITEIGGIGGYTPVANTVFISLDPRHRHFKRALKAELPYILAHELHHAVRFRTPIPYDSLLEAMVSEGLADHFALLVSGRSKPLPWCTALSAAQTKVFSKQARKVWRDRNYPHAVWFYGADPKRIPRWAGYTLAFDLVGEYLSTHPQTEAASLVAAPAKTFIR